MKQIINLTFVDYRFKVKLLGVFLLIAAVEIVTFAIPSKMLESPNTMTNIFGLILMVPLIAVIFVFTYKVMTEKLVGYYNPNIKVKPVDIIYKALAMLCITYPVGILMYFVAFIFTVMFVLGKSLIVGLELILVYLFLVFQVIVLNTSLYYIILDLIEGEEYGFKCVFKSLLKKLKTIRKQIIGIAVVTMVYTILSFIFVSIEVSVFVSINDQLLGNASSGQAGLFMIILEIVLVLAVLVISQITISQYLVIKYGDIRGKI